MSSTDKITFDTELFRLDSAVWSICFFVPDTIAKKLIRGKNKRVICEIKDEKFHCALMPHGDGNFFINVNKSIRERNNLQLGKKFTISLSVDDSKYGIPMPEEMEELLSIDPSADQYFHALTLGKQRALIHMVGKLKKSPSRLNKAIGITEYLKQNYGQLDFKALNAFLKDHNKMS